jgi:hypothetical protein
MSYNFRLEQLRPSDPCLAPAGSVKRGAGCPGIAVRPEPQTFLHNTCVTEVCYIWIEIWRVCRGPTFEDLVTIRTEASMQDVTVARLESTRVKTLLSPSFNVMYCVRVSLWTVEIFLEQHQREGGRG